MIILITGQPGGGKTALCVDMLANHDQFKGRPLFVMGIPELQIEHTQVPPVSEWTELRASPEDPELMLPYFTFPPNAVVVIDEAQRVYRPRNVGSKVPLEVAAFETHRHTGVDFILLTQHPGLLDSNIRKLVGKHIHIKVTPFGRYTYEWPECGEPESKTSRDIAARNKYKLPKRIFKLYKSSELHTKIKLKMPMYLWVFIGASLACVVLGWYVWHRINSRLDPSGQTVDKINGKTTTREHSGPITTADYLQARTPRVEGLAHTAPLYDSVTAPTDAPWPTGCIKTAKTCRCVDQQGNDYATTQSICLQIVEHGLFKDWANKAQDDQRTPQQTAKPAGAGDVGRMGSVAQPLDAPVPQAGA